MNVIARLSIAAACCSTAFAACAPESGNNGGGRPSLFSGTGGQAGGGGLPDASATGGSVGAGGGDGLGGGVFSTGDGGPVVRPGYEDASCKSVTQAPEEIIIYRDATVTDTIVTYSPVALYIMLDRSSSMVGIAGDPTSWPNATGAITAFVNDPVSAGMDVGLAVFPPISNAGGNCDGSDCGQPVVPIGPLPQHATDIANGLQSSGPVGLLFTPTECALRGMINYCKQYSAQASEQCVAILVTDGAPTTCDLNTQNLVNIVAQGKTDGITTFAIGLPGSNIGFLNQLAQAGGSGAAVDLTSGGQQAFLDALNNIRGKVSVSVSSQVTTQTVVSQPLDCQWKLPAPPQGQTFDPKKVNVQLTPKDAPVVSFGKVENEADCARASDGWYYDDNATPTQVFVCPNTCNTFKGLTGARVDIVLGCETVPAILN